MINYLITENVLTVPETEDTDKVTVLLSGKNTFSGTVLAELFKKKNIDTLMLPDAKPESISFTIGCMIGQLKEDDKIVICDNKITLAKNIFDFYPISYLEEKKKVVRKRKKKEDTKEIKEEIKEEMEEVKEKPKKTPKKKDEVKEPVPTLLETEDFQKTSDKRKENHANAEVKDFEKIPFAAEHLSEDGEYQNIPISKLDIYKKRGCEATKKKIDEILEGSENLDKRGLERKINTSFLSVHDVKILKECLLEEK